MHYEEFPIPSVWQSHFECLWILRAPPQDHVIYPDGRCELILHLGVPPSRAVDGGWSPQAPLLFAAQCRRALRLRAKEPLHCVGLRLRPAASACLWPADESDRLQAWKDQVVDAGLWLPQAQNMPHGPAARVPDALLALAAGAVRQAPHALAQRACARIDELNGQLSVRSMARDLGVSVRTLQLQFAQAVGLSPKEYARIRRLQATLHLLDNGATALAEAAQRAGFSDQAHATRELRTLAGLTPARLRQALAAERAGEQALALAAAFIRGQALDRHR